YQAPLAWRKKSSPGLFLKSAPARSNPQRPVSAGPARSPAPTFCAIRIGMANTATRQTSLDIVSILTLLSPNWFTSANTRRRQIGKFRNRDLEFGVLAATETRASTRDHR